MTDESRLIVRSIRTQRFFSTRFESESIEFEYFSLGEFCTSNLASSRSGSSDRHVALFEESVKHGSNHDEVGFGREESGGGEEMVEGSWDIDMVYVASDNRETRK